MSDNTNLFADQATVPAIDPDKDYFPELVGEGKKYKDQKAAGRALVEKDAFIEQLKKENAEAREAYASVREDANANKTLKTVLDRLDNLRTTPPSSNEQTTAPEPERSNPNPNPADIESIVQQAVSKQSEKAIQDKNFNHAIEVLEQNYGPGYAQVLRQKTRELGLGENFVNDLARKQPKALFKLLDVSEISKTASNPRPSLLSNPGTKASAGKNNAYWENLRKSDPDKYGRSMQERINAVQALGDAFWE